MCSGASGVEIAPETEDELRFGEALDALLRQLALDIVRDGEGAARVGRVVVTGGDGEAVERAARGVANSPLVKAALNGGDPNWGRIAQAVGGALPGHRAARRSTSPSRACRSAPAARRPASTRPRSPSASRATRSSTSSACRARAHETEVFFSDLSHGYVTINAEYTT